MPKRQNYSVSKNPFGPSLIFKNERGSSYLESYRTKKGSLISRLGFVKKGKVLIESKPLKFKRK